jgi:hypothetical protein
MAENFSNDFQTTLTNAVSGSSSSITIASATGSPAANFRIRIDDEIMLVTAKAGLTWTVTRGIEGTIAVAHTLDTTVSHVVTTGGLAQYVTEALAPYLTASGASATYLTAAAAASTYFPASSAGTMATQNANAVAITGGTINGTPVNAYATLSGMETFANKTLTTPVLNGTPTGTGVATAATASTLALRDASGNLTAANYIPGYATTATAAGTTTLTVTSAQTQVFTGTSTQRVVLPATSTLSLGLTYRVVNNSTGAVTVQSSGANNILVLRGGTEAVFTCVLTSGASAASWIQDQISTKNIPINVQSAAYTITASDFNAIVQHPSSDATGRTFTLDSNTNVPRQFGVAVTFINGNAAGVVTIAVTTDTMRLAGTGTTGSRSLAANGIATAVWISPGEWQISGTGLT